MARILRPLARCVLVLAAACGWHASARPAAAARIVLLAEAELGAPGRHGAEVLLAALRARGAAAELAASQPLPGALVIRAGLGGRDGAIHDLVYRGRIAVPPDPESYTLRRLQPPGPALVVAGSDERGLLYGLTELARRVSRAAPALSAEAILAAVPDLTEKPALPVRGMVQFLHSAALEGEWYHDERYWDAYLDMLARDRFNQFNLVFAHQTEYLAPPYPFLFSVEQYPGVRVPGLAAAQQTQNLETLKMISRKARERGIDFIMGIWEHRAWRVGQRSMVDGLDDAILADYSRLAISKLLRLCPDISGIQLRVNTESGIDLARQTEFYSAVFAGMKAAERPVLLDLRGWGALPGTIEAAARSGLPLRLSMKYWAEFMGMPYQAAQMAPSYSYADFLRYPRPSPVLYQLWSLGSHRLLPWGSADWLRRFVPTAKLGDAVGFETCAPLSQKGFGNLPGAWRIFPSREREYYTWEFERYWLYYLLFGRLSYNPAAAEDVWLDELRARFGPAATALSEAFAAASEVVPFLSSYRLSNPNMYIWPEKQMGGLLDFYLEVKPADEARFAAFDEYVARRLRGAPTARMLPEAASERLLRMADATERALARGGAALAGTTLAPAAGRELDANRVDLAVLAHLARYHAHKIRAAANLALFYASGDDSALRAAQSQAAAGLEIWQRLVRLTDGIYHPRMVFGPRDVGHWKDNLVFVRHDVDRLREVETLLERYGLFDLGLDFGPPLPARVRRPYEPPYSDTYPVERRFRLLDPTMTYSAERRYGWLDTAGIAGSPGLVVPYTSLEGDNLDDLALPAQVLYRDYLKGTRASRLRLDLPDGEYRVTAIVANQPELATGAFHIRSASAPGIDYALGETGDKAMDVRVSGGSLELEVVPEPGASWLVSGLVVARRAPRIAHVPVWSAAPGTPLRVAATIMAPDSVSEAAVQYRLEPRGPVETLALVSEGRRFVGSIPLDPKWEGRELRYALRARDRRGVEARLPAIGEYTVRIGRDTTPPAIVHTPVAVCEPQKPLRLVFSVTDPSGLALARLRYRRLSQSEEYREVDLVPAAGAYEATIPADTIAPTHDLMYYVEAVDRFGNGACYPDPDRTAPYVVVRVRR